MVEMDQWGLPVKALVGQKEIVGSRLGVTKEALLWAVRQGRLRRVRVGKRKGKYVRLDVFRVFRPNG